MRRLEIFLLGSFQVKLDGKAVTGFESGKVRALLAYLALENKQPQPREKLAGLLWPEHNEKQARHNLSQALYSLRKELEKDGERFTGQSRLLVSPQTIQLDLMDDDWLDVETFLDLLDASETHRHDRMELCEDCMKRLQQAAALYRGDFISDFSVEDGLVFEEWALLVRERLRGRLITGLIRLVDFHTWQGEYTAALPYAKRRVELDPFWEEAQRTLMRLLALCGRRSEALRQYENYRCLLETELKVEPERLTAALARRIRLEAEGATPDHLPHPITPGPPNPFRPGPDFSAISRSSIFASGRK